MAKIIAFDVETPNRANNRISAIGITVIEDKKISSEFYSLINPETYFESFNVQLTGIDKETVRNAPTFPEIWTKIEPIMSSGILLAHNAIFDMSVLKKCLQDYNIAWKKTAPYLCTVQIGRRIIPAISHKLDVLCDYYGINLNHHQAVSDSRACAEIFLRYLETGADLMQFKKTYRL